MKLVLQRKKGLGRSTPGTLFVDGEEVCRTLEDEVREVKVAGETAIPAGTYKVMLRTEGGFHGRYKKRWPDIHKGMLWVRNVPNFEYILIHCGNTVDDSRGCVLVGETLWTDKKEYKLANSAKAYLKFYPTVADALLAGDSVTLEVRDVDPS